ncbi:MAG: ABC transporter ATP-binding protein [Pyrinomonadaceae bacterium]
MNFVVEIENLVKDYETGFLKKKKVRAVDGISLAVSGGQIFGFLGGNGAGKTTTIKILMSLLYPTSGNARILGRSIDDLRMHERIGYCPENPYFYDYLTPRELLGYFGELFGLDAARTRKRSEELLTRVGLDEKDWNKQLRKFSKGMLQRVGLAQSLINEPEIVFLDEPMSGLDPIGRREVRELIADLREKGTTVFMSTHILSDVEALCDEVAILRKGKIGAMGKLDDLLAAEAERQSYEVTLKGLENVTLGESFPEMPSSAITLRGNGVSIVCRDENEIDAVLSASRRLGGKLVSIQPVKQSLEELFVEPAADGS